MAGNRERLLSGIGQKYRNGPEPVRPVMPVQDFVRTPLVLFLLAFAPTFFPSVHVVRVDLSLGILVATAALFLPPGFLALKAAVRILRAEALIRRQPK